MDANHVEPANQMCEYRSPGGERGQIEFVARLADHTTDLKARTVERPRQSNHTFSATFLASRSAAYSTRSKPCTETSNRLPSGSMARCSAKGRVDGRPA